MTADHETPSPRATTDATGFARVVCGIDGSREGFEAARQAARLTSADGRLALVAVVDLYSALAARWGPERPRRRVWDAKYESIEDCFVDLRARAADSLDLARGQVGAGPEVTTRVVDGSIDLQILEAAEAEGASLIAVGSHGGSRLAGAVIGEATSMILHDAPVSVLVARPSFEPGRFPATIVVGIDGSPGAREALDVGAELRERSGGRLTVVTAHHDGGAAAESLQGFDAPHELIVSTDRPVEALIDAARTADLLVVGSRGLHGAKALGSVSERVAHRAPSSVLVVRTPRPPTTDPGS